MSSTLLSIRTDDKTKKEITEFANSVGLSVSAFVSVVLKQAVKEGRVVLSPTLEPTSYLKELIKQADSEYKNGKDITTIHNKAELHAFFDSL